MRLRGFESFQKFKVSLAFAGKCRMQRNPREGEDERNFKIRASSTTSQIRRLVCRPLFDLVFLLSVA